MVETPEKLLRDYVDAGVDLITVHAEASVHLHRCLGQIRELGARAAVTIVPSTPVAVLDHVLDLVDMVLIMTVNPGFGGQAYLASQEPKVADLRRTILERGLDVDIEVDGGIAPGTIGAITEAGANVFVAGNAVFKAPGGLAQAIADLRTRAEAAQRPGRAA
jgi:ribulose-phosphate 3-epimerase